MTCPYWKVDLHISSIFFSILYFSVWIISRGIDLLYPRTMEKLYRLRKYWLSPWFILLNLGGGMFNLLCSCIKIILSIFKTKRFLICEIAMLKKEIEILKRKQKKKVNTNCFDRLFFVILHKIANIKDRITIVKPETVHTKNYICFKFWDISFKNIFIINFWSLIIPFKIHLSMEFDELIKWTYYLICFKHI